MNKSTNKISQKVIQRPNVTGVEFTVEDPEKEQKKEAAAESARASAKVKAIVKKARSFDGIAETIAQDKFFQRNHIWPGSKQAFPFQPKMQTVDKYFPYAEGGPLFIDEPTRKEDLKEFSPKIEAMKKLGHRYLLIKPGMNELEAREALA